ncbi:dapper homolog 3 [Brachionichthys hirsutus]|uniref:dapper homolog 3 n=1 Tax=Brachionichthys hirsutus TaxID=412623 RepID=UPI003604C4ED
MELYEDCSMSDWEAVLELDEALAGWLLQGPAGGDWGWAASDPRDPECDSEEIPASALQSSPWGLMQALEQQVGELRVDADDGCYDGAQDRDTADGQPTPGFYELSEGQLPKGRWCSSELAETASSWAYADGRPKSVGDPFMLSGETDAPAVRTTLPRSFSAPYPPLEGIAEEGTAIGSWQWELSGADHDWQAQPAEDRITEEDYQQAMRVEGYILGLLQRHTQSPRPCQPRTTLSPDPPYCNASGHSSLQKRTTEQRLPDPHFHSHDDLLANPNSQTWGCDLLEREACGGDAPSLEGDCYLALPYPQPRPHSLAEKTPSPLASLDPNCGVGALDLSCEPPSPQNYLQLQPPIHRKHNLLSGQYIPGQGYHTPGSSPRHYNLQRPNPSRAPASPDPSKSRNSKKSRNERQRAKKSSGKTDRSQSENSLLGQRVLPERRYSTTERHQGRGELSLNEGQVLGSLLSSSGQNGSRRWCSNVELSQDEGESLVGQAQRRSHRKTRHGHYCPHSQTQNYHQQLHQHSQHRQGDCQERAPLCQGEEGYAGGVPVESESSMSEVYSPASSSPSSDSDESGGLVWPQQLPPRIASTSSSSSPSSQAAAKAPPQPKAFVKIKASHALKKKILRFRSGSLKVMTTV